MHFEDIQKLKLNSRLVINNINFGKIIAAKLYSNSIKFTFKCVILSLLFEGEIIYSNNSSKILISYINEPGRRKDQEYMYDLLKTIIEDYNEIKIKRKFTFNKLFIRIIELIRMINNNNSLNVKLLDNFRISALEVYFLNIHKKLRKIKFEEKLYISFCDSYMEENLFAQYLSNKKIITATLQHGQYRYIKKGYETTDVEAYLSFVSDYLFSWGQVTKNEFIKAGIQDTKILNVGALKEFSNRKILKPKKKCKTFCLILNGQAHSSSNIKMIKLANEIAEVYEMYYYIRPHPMNKLKNYTKFIDSRYFIGTMSNKTFNINEINFSLLHMTAVFVEMLSYNSLFFVFNDEWTEELFKIELITIKNLSEFSIKYNNFLNNPNIFLETLNTYYNKFNCCSNYDELKKNYHHSIKQILQKDCLYE